MSLNYQDYYKTLGVERSASQDDIQKSFRKLARKYHPDINKEKSAEDKFKELNEAYEVLKDPEKRKKYDALGANWQNGQEFQAPPGFESVFQSGGGFRQGGGFSSGSFSGNDGFSSFFESLFGGNFQNFSQSGFSQGSSGQSKSSKAQNFEASLPISIYDAFHGATKSVTFERQTVSGKLERKTYKIKIPAGTKDSSTIRLAGKGSPGVGSQKPGDLLIKISVTSDSFFSLKGKDLVNNLEITPWDAILGAKIPIRTMDGEVNLKIPTGTQHQTKLRMKGKGLKLKDGTSGDLIVKINIVIPKTVTEDQKKLLEELKKLSASSNV